MRLSDADRELIYERLSRHHAAGRLSIAELERRVALVAGADTREQAGEALRDLPPLPVAERPARRAWWRRRGHGEADAPDPGWTATSERFRDPRTGRLMRVWVDGGGGRHYVPDDTSV